MGAVQVLCGVPSRERPAFTYLLSHPHLAEISGIMGVDNTDEHDDDNNESDSNDDEATRSHQRNERLEQNRISARESRKRKKNLIEELQRTVITLSRENKELMERNEGLRRELMDLGTKNPGVVRSC